MIFLAKYLQFHAILNKGKYIIFGCKIQPFFSLTVQSVIAGNRFKQLVFLKLANSDTVCYFHKVTDDV